MEKEFIDEMIDALNELRLSEAQRVYDAVKNRERPPLTMKPSVIMQKIFVQRKPLVIRVVQKSLWR